jgi:ABC-type transport system substrate-binding protein
VKVKTVTACSSHQQERKMVLTSPQRTQINRRNFLASLMAGLCAGAVGQSAYAAPEHGGILRIAYPFQPTSLDPALGRQNGDFDFLYPVFETLVDWEFDTMLPKPALATSWTFSDPTTFVLKLQENVVFHDGTPFDAIAVKFNLDRCLTDPKSTVKTDLATVSSVEVSGAHEITIHLKRPNASLPLILSGRAGFMASPNAVAKLGDQFARNPVGTGPWKFTTWRDNEILSYRRNENYRSKGQPLTDGVDFKIIADSNTGLRSVIAGENDFVWALSSAQKPAVDRSGLQYSIGTSQQLFLVWINQAKGALGDVRVRQALNYAIDRNAYNKVTEGGLNEVAHGIIPKAHWAYDPAVENYYPYDPGKARSLLAAAGFANGLDLTLTGPNDQPSTQRQEFVIEQLKQVGIRIKLKALSVNDSIKTYFYDKEADLLLIVWGSRQDPSMMFSTLFSKDSPTNPSGIEPDGFADALAASQASPDVKLRMEALSKLQHIVAENALVVPLAFDAQYSAFTKKLKGYRPNLFGRMRIDSIYLET